MPITYRIHPAIGVARVGDSLDDYFIGPEAPGVPPTLSKPDAPAVPGGKKGTYKDSRRVSNGREHDSESMSTPPATRAP